MAALYNPANGITLENTVQQTDKDLITAVIERSQEEFTKWSATSFDERAKLMNTAADLLEKRKEKYALLMTKEMGKMITESRSEIEKCAWVCRYYAENAADFLSDQLVETDATKSYEAYRPLGIILAVMPWNFPFWQVFRFAAPTLMAGNAGLLKHASNVPQCADAIQEVFRDAGFPEHLFTTLHINTKLVETVIEHRYVKAVTLTGSDKAGRAVAEIAGRNLKKSVLELGGSDPYLILEDANLQQAVDQCLESRMINTGQSCIAAKRFIVVDKIYYSFVSLLVEKMRNLKVGDPLIEDNDLGPMARFDLRDELHDQVTKSVEKGAKLELGGVIPPGEGAYYSPTLLTNVTPGMPAYEEELFGPVAVVIRAKDEADAIRIANDSEFGLGGGVFTKDLERGEDIAKNKIQTGSCFVNAYVKSDPRLPFGGIGISGFGRELAQNGILEFVNIKTIYIR